MELLQIKNLTFTYRGCNGKALDSIELSIEKGSVNLVIGPSGCGKSTLLRLIADSTGTYGEQTGSIIFSGKGAAKGTLPIGLVAQMPDEQIVTDTVKSELSFGLENLGVPQDEIGIRVAEAANYFGIQELYNKTVDELSGGQKQLLNLAAVTVLQPELLLLDEPTAQLDPISAAAFISTVMRLNSELGITVIISEHNTEEILQYADTVTALDHGKALFFGSARDACMALSDSSAFVGFPTSAKVWKALGKAGACPISVKECRQYILNGFQPRKNIEVKKKSTAVTEAAVELKHIRFRYEKNGNDILADTSLSVRRGEIFSVLGGNGSGKTTLLNVIAGLERPYSGMLKINGKAMASYKGNSLYRHCIAMLPQDPNTLFLKETVADELHSFADTVGITDDEKDITVERVIQLLEVKELLNRHPYDLSGGEKQKCAFAKLLLSDPQIFLLDEPTKGMDALCKGNLHDIISMLKSNGKTVVLVTHDIEFAAAVSDRCSMIFDGKALPPSPPEVFFRSNFLYTTAAVRISRGITDNVTLCDDLVTACKGTQIK